MERKKRLRILAGITGFLLIGALLVLWNGFSGNPVSAAIATWKIKEYVQETYPEKGFSVENARYSFKTGGYGCIVSLPDSPDTVFEVSYGGGKIRDDYQQEVETGFSTYRRLDQQLDAEIERLVAEKLPYKTTLVLGTMDPKEDMSDVLTLDMPFDPHNLPLPVEVSVWVDTQEITYEEAARVLKQLDGIFQEAGIPIDRYSIRLISVKEYDKSGNALYDFERGEINVLDFPSSRIGEEPLAQVMEEHQLHWQEEKDREKESEALS